MIIPRNLVAGVILLMTASFAAAQQPTCDSISNSGSPATSTSFEVYANNVQNASKVLFPTWTDANGQDELIWYEGEYDAANNRWKRTVNISEHNNESGSYTTHAYALANDNQYYNLGGTATTVDFAAPTCDSITTSANPVTSSSYEVYANNIKNATRVQFPTWTDANGQDDDIRWYEGEYDAANNRWKCTVNISEHNNESGAYTTHVYATGADNQQYNVGSTTAAVGVPMGYITIPTAASYSNGTSYSQIQFEINDLDYNGIVRDSVKYTRVESFGGSGGVSYIISWVGMGQGYVIWQLTENRGSHYIKSLNIARYMRRGKKWVVSEIVSDTAASWKYMVVQDINYGMYPQQVDWTYLVQQWDYNAPRKNGTYTIPKQVLQ